MSGASPPYYRSFLEGFVHGGVGTTRAEGKSGIFIFVCAAACMSRFDSWIHITKTQHSDCMTCNDRKSLVGMTSVECTVGTGGDVPPLDGLKSAGLSGFNQFGPEPGNPLCSTPSPKHSRGSRLAPQEILIATFPQSSD